MRLITFAIWLVRIPLLTIRRRFGKPNIKNDFSFVFAKLPCTIRVGLTAFSKHFFFSEFHHGDNPAGKPKLKMWTGKQKSKWYVGVDTFRETQEEKGRKKNPGRKRKKEKDREERRKKRKKKREALLGHFEKGSIRPQKRLLEPCVPLNQHVQNSTKH